MDRLWSASLCKQSHLSFSLLDDSLNSTLASACQHAEQVKILSFSSHLFIFLWCNLQQPHKIGRTECAKCPHPHSKNGSGWRWQLIEKHLSVLFTRGWNPPASRMWWAAVGMPSSALATASKDKQETSNCSWSQWKPLMQSAPVDSVIILFLICNTNYLRHKCKR